MFWSISIDVLHIAQLLTWVIFVSVSLMRENLRELRDVFFSQNPNLSRHREYVFSNDSNVRRGIWIPEGSIDNLWFSLVLLLSKLCIIVLWDLRQTLISWVLPVPVALKLTDPVRAILPEKKNQIHIKISRIFMKNTSDFWSLAKLVFYCKFVFSGETEQK